MSAGSDELLAKLAVDVRQAVDGLAKINASMAQMETQIKSLEAANKRLATTVVSSYEKRFNASIKLGQQQQRYYGQLAVSMDKDEAASQRAAAAAVAASDRKVAASVREQEQRRSIAASILASMNQEEAAQKRLTAQNLSAAQSRFAASVQQAEQQRRYHAQLAASMDKDEAALKGQKAAVQEVSLSWQSLVRIVAIQLAHQAISALVRGIAEGVAEAKELTKRIAEIQTISQKRQLPFEAWSEGLRSVSNAFGLDIIDTAEAAYQALSNQVVKGAETFRFLEDAMRFGVTSVATAEDSVNLLTAALNAFHKNTSETEQVAANFFKTIELGRVRASEMANAYGRIAVPANQLKVEMEELNAIISTATIQGLKYNEVSTQIRGVLVKLIKPTKEMKELLSEIGVSSGEAAIETYGLTGFLKLLAERTGGSSTEIAKFIPRIRGMNLAMLLASKEGLSTYNRVLAESSNSLEAYRKANEITLNSVGKQYEQMITTVKNYFIVDLGVDVVKSLVAINKHVISLELVIKSLADVLSGVLIVAALAAVKALGALALTPMGALLTALGAVVVAINYMQKAEKDRADAWKKSWDESRKFAEQAIAKTTKAITDQIDASTKVTLVSIAEVTGGWTELANNQEKIIKSSNETIATSYKATAKIAKSALTEINKDLSDARKELESIAKFAVSFNQTVQKEIFEEGLKGIAPVEQLKQFNKAIKETMALSEAAAKAGNVDQQQDAIKRLFELTKQRSKLARTSSNEETKITEELAKLKEKTEQKLSDLKDKRRRAVKEKDKRAFRAARDDEIKTVREAAKKKEELEGKLKKIRLDGADAVVARTIKDYKAILKLAEDQEKTLREKKIADIKALTKLQIEQVKLIADFEAAYKKSKAFDIEKTLTIGDEEQINKALKDRQENLNELAILYKKINNEVALTALNELKVAEQKIVQSRTNKILLDQQRELIKAQADNVKERAKELGGAATDAKLRELEFKKSRNLIQESRVPAISGELGGGPVETALRSLQKASRHFGAAPNQFTKEQLAARAYEFAQISKSVTAVTAREQDKLNKLRAAASGLYNILQDTNNPIADSIKAQELHKSALEKQEKILKDVNKEYTEQPSLIQRSINTMEKLNEAVALRLTGESQIAAILKKQADILKGEGIVPKKKDPLVEAKEVNLPKKATGGDIHGSDSVHAMLSPGEFVVNAGATRKFYSQLVAMNSGTRAFANGGAVTNVGDINVSMSSSGNAELDVVHIGKALHREIRRGTIKLN